MAISTDARLNELSLDDLLLASTCLLNAFNSKGRITPLHLQSAPGVGKTMMCDTLAIEQARAVPGVPYGYGVFNPGNNAPTDAAGFTLFESYTYPEGHSRAGQTEKVSIYTRPTCFILRCAYVAHPESKRDRHNNILVRRVNRDVLGQPLFPEAIIACPWTGKHLEIQDGMILLDEFMQADVEVRKVLAPLTDEGRVATSYLPPGFAVWMASNRAKDASGTGKAMAFLTNRACIMEVRPSVKGLLDYLKHPGASATASLPGGIMDLSRLPQRDAAGRFERRAAHPCILAYAEQEADTLFAGVPADPSQPFLTPRSLEAVSNLFDVMMVTGDDSDSNNESNVETNEDVILSSEDRDRSRIFTAVTAGLIGSDNANQFMATVELFGEVPKVQDMAANPATARVSDKKDAQLIAAYVAANGMTIRNGNALMAYAKRLHPTLLGNVVINAITRNGELMTLTSVAKYFADNPNAMSRMVMARAGAARAAGRSR